MIISRLSNVSDLKREVNMKKTILFCILLFFVASFTLQAQTWLTGSLDEAQAQAKAQGKMLLVDFYVESG